MKKYEAYKDSGVEWLGEIPEHWKVLKVKYVLEFSKDGIKIGPFGSSLTGKVLPNGNYKVYGQWNILEKDFSAGKNYISSKTYNDLESYQVIPGDILISMMGTVGKCAIIPKGIINGIMDSHVVKVRLNHDIISPKFFEYVYDKDLSNVIYSQIQKNKRGSIMDGLNSSVIKNFLMPIPSISEQNAIIKYLDFKVSHIDSLISEKQNQIKDLQKYRASMISEIVTRGLNPNVEMKESGIEWIGIIPKHWVICRIKDSVCLINDRATKSSLKKIGLENIESATGKYIETDSDFSGEGIEFQKNDILFGKLRPYLAKVYKADFEGQSVGDIYVFRNKHGFAPDFLKYLFISDMFISVVDGSTYGAKMPRANWDFISSLQFAFPSINEQQEIATYLDTKTFKIDETINELKTQIEDLRKYKTSVISEAVTGKVDLRGWKPK